jgi:hypothetical protein
MSKWDWFRARERWVRQNWRGLITDWQYVAGAPQRQLFAKTQRSPTVITLIFFASTSAHKQTPNLLNSTPLSYYHVHFCRSWPGSVVGIATAYGLDGPGIESRWGWDFPHLFRPALRPISLLHNGYRVFPGGKVRPGREADSSPPSSAEVKNRVELYLYSP